MTLVEKLGLMVTAVGFYNCVRFVVTYWQRSGGAWRTDPHGRYMMFTALVLGSLFALIISNRLWPDWPGRGVVALVLYLLYVMFTGTLNKILEMSYPAKKKEETQNEQPSDIRA